jgi:hypothetical protein
MGGLSDNSEMARFDRDVRALKSFTGVTVLVLMLCMATLWLDMRDGVHAGAMQDTLLDPGFDNQTVISSFRT